MAKPKNQTIQVFFFFGSEEFLLKEKVQNQFGDQILNMDQTSLEVLDGTVTSLEEILASIQTPPLFASQKFVWVKNFKMLERGHSKNEDEFINALKTGLPEQNILIFTNTKVDQRLKMVNELKKVSHCEEVGASQEWYKEQTREILGSYHKKIHPEAYDLLCDLIGSDPAKFVKELEKIVTYIGPLKTEIEAKDVLAIASPNYEQPFFRFVDELLFGKISLSLKTLRQLMLQGENAIGLVTYLLNNLRLLLQARSLTHEGYISELKIPISYRKVWVDAAIQSLPEDLRSSSPKESNLFRQHPYRFFILVKQSVNFTILELKNMFLNACKAYWELVNSRPSEKVLEKLILSLKVN